MPAIIVARQSLFVTSNQKVWIASMKLFGGYGSEYRKRRFHEVLERPQRGEPHRERDDPWREEIPEASRHRHGEEQRRRHQQQHHHQMVAVSQRIHGEEQSQPPPR